MVRRWIAALIVSVVGVVGVASVASASVVEIVNRHTGEVCGRGLINDGVAGTNTIPVDACE